MMTESCTKSNISIPEGDCYIHLFDGNRFKDDNYVLQGPGEFPDLSRLPGAGKNWDDEADSFKVGSKSTVTIWTKKNFEGESKTYGPGTEVPSTDEPRSIRIECD